MGRDHGIEMAGGEVNSSSVLETSSEVPGAILHDFVYQGHRYQHSEARKSRRHRVKAHKNQVLSKPEGPTRVQLHAIAGTVLH
jgi:hypothetical protein